MSVLARVLRVAANEPEHVAVKDSTRELNYESLATEAARVATGLLSLGVGSGDRVVIRLSTSVDALVVAFGSMWIGAIFIPVSLSDPLARLTAVLGDCAPTIVVARPDDNDIPEGPWIRVAFDDLEHGDAVVLESPPEDGLAYCIYTSGTTGTPKGVVIGHKSFAHATQATITELGMGPSVRTLCISAFHFDGSFASMFTTLSVGGSLVILRREPMVLPSAFVRTVRDEDIDIVFCSPSFLRLLLVSQSLAKLATSRLSQIVFGGEASVARYLLDLLEALPKVRLYNQYGPTETAISVALHEITADQLGSGDVPLGQPHPGVTFTLFDDNDQLVDLTNASGELYVGGSQLMEGYWGDTELSKRVLRRDLVQGSVLYRTGDLARRNAAGDYVYVGRVDRVVKRTGVRISLDEIERLLRQLPGVANAACFATTDDEATRIVAHAAVTTGVTSSELLTGLGYWLPRSMIPDELSIVESIPLTAAGKIDYRALVDVHGD